jgi:hypothetical protein
MKLRVLGVKLRLGTVAALGVGFLLGSRAGRGPWDSLSSKLSQYQSRNGTGLYSGNGHGLTTSEEVDVRSQNVPFGEI